jgi:hypothetical protein
LEMDPVASGSSARATLSSGWRRQSELRPKAYQGRLAAPPVRGQRVLAGLTTAGAGRRSLYRDVNPYSEEPK